MAHVAEYKKRIVNELTKLISDYPVIAVVSVENVPAPQLQKVRAQIRDSVVIMMSKRRLVKLALDNAKDAKKGIEKLKEHLQGMPALMFTKENPFKLAAVLMKSKSKAPAKAGQTAPNDIVIEAGPTSFAPGPVIGELGQLGIKTMVESGKIVIKENKVLVKKGEKISENAAAILTRLGIEPMEVGLMPEAAYEDGLIFTRDVLEVDEKEYIDNLNIAESEAFNLAVDIKYPVKEVVEMLIAKAFNEAKTVGVEFKIIDKDVIDNLLGIAESEMLSLKEGAGIKVKEEKAEEKKVEVKEEKKEEEPKVEEKKEEEPSEEEVKEEEIKEEEKEIEKEKPKEDIPKAEELTKKEEKVLEEEKEIIKEEVELEKKEEEGAPVEKEVQEAVKEEEEKLLEKERIEKEEEVEKIEKEREEIKEKAKEPKEEVDMSETQGVSEHTKKFAKRISGVPEKRSFSEDNQEPAVLDEKIEEMVKKTKDFVEGKIPSAEKLVDEAEEDVKEEIVEEKEEEIKKEPKKKEAVEEKKEEAPSAHELGVRKMEKEETNPEIKKKKEKEEKERKDVEEIVKKLQRGEKI